MPVKDISIKEQQQFIEIVNNILNLTNDEYYLENQKKQEQVKEYEKQIDIMVYKLYNLDYNEVLTVDTEFKMSESDYNNYFLPYSEVVCND